MLRAYIVGERDGESENVLVFANNQKEARKLGSRRVDYDDKYIHLPVERWDQADNLLRADAADAYVEFEPKVLREAGWQIDGESTCDSCGLAPMDMDEFAICGDCCQCPECGCECEDSDSQA